MRAQEVSIVTPTSDEMNRILAAVQLAGHTEPPLVPQGKVGGCVACGHSAASHFKAGENGAAEFIGCLKGQPDTVYILLPVNHGKKTADIHMTMPQVDTANDTGVQTHNGHKRLGRRLRYFSTLHHKAKPENVRIDEAELSETRLKVLKAVHEAGIKTGIRSKDILKKTKLPHGSVQQTLNWLRAQGFVDAKVEAAKTPVIKTAAA